MRAQLSKPLLFLAALSMLTGGFNHPAQAQTPPAIPDHLDVEKYQARFEASQEQASTAQQELQLRESQLQEQQKLLEDWAQTLLRGEQKYRELEQRKETLLEDIPQIEGEKQRLLAELGEVDAQLVQINHRLTDLDAQRLVAEGVWEEARAELARREERLLVVRGRLGRESQLLRDLRQEIKTAQANLTSLQGRKGALARAKREMEAEVGSLRDEITRQQPEVARLERELQEERRALTAAKQHQESLEEELAVLAKAHQEAQAKLSAWEKQDRELGDQIAELQGEIKDLGKTMKRLEEELPGWREKERELPQQISASQGQEKFYRDEIAVGEKFIQQLNGEIEAAAPHLQAGEAQLKRWEQELEQKRKEVERLKEQGQQQRVAALEKQIKALQEQRGRLAKSLSTLKGTVSNKRRQLQVTEKALKTQRGHLLEAQRQTKRWERQLEESKQTVARLEREREQAQAQQERSRKQVKEWEREQTSVRQKMEEQRPRVVKAQQKWQRKKDQVDQARRFAREAQSREESSQRAWEGAQAKVTVARQRIETLQRQLEDNIRAWQTVLDGLARVDQTLRNLGDRERVQLEALERLQARGRRQTELINQQLIIEEQERGVLQAVVELIELEEIEYQRWADHRLALEGGVLACDERLRSAEKEVISIELTLPKLEEQNLQAQEEIERQRVVVEEFQQAHQKTLEEWENLQEIARLAGLEYQRRRDQYNAAWRVAHQKGTQQGEERGSQAGAQRGAEEALPLAQADGSQLGKQEALLRNYEQGLQGGRQTGEREGIQRGKNDPRYYDTSFERGLAEGKELAYQRAREVDLPRGREAKKAQWLARALPLKEDEHISSYHIPRRGKMDESTFWSAPSSQEWNAPLGRAADSAYEKLLLLIEQVAGQVLNLQHSYQQLWQDPPVPAVAPVVDTAGLDCQAELPALSEACRQAYQEAYERSFREAMRAEFIATYRPELERAHQESLISVQQLGTRLQEGHDEAYPVALFEFERRTSELEQERGLQEGRAAGVERWQALASQEMFQRGEQLAQEYLERNALVRFQGLALTSGERLQAGSTVSVELTMANYGGLATEVGQIQVRLEVLSGNFFVKGPLYFSLKALAAQTQTRFRPFAKLKIDPQWRAGEAVVLKMILTYPNGQVEEQFLRLGELR